MGTFIVKFLLIFIATASTVYSESIALNVTKLQASKTLRIPDRTAVLPPPPIDNGNPNHTNLSRNNESAPAQGPTIPKAISGFSAFPAPQNFNFEDKDDLEETFTYQVKKQNKRPINFPSDSNKELNFLKQRIMNDAYEETRGFVNDLNQQMSEKIRRIQTTFDSMNKYTIQNISSLNSSLHQQNSDVYNLTILAKASARSLQTLQLSHELERTFTRSKIANLTGQVEKLQGEKTEELKRVMESVSAIQMKVDNATQELRVHEAYIRYGQQLMASMKSSIETSDDKITGLQTDGGPQWAEQTTGCGGVIVANSGIISYKFRQPYLDNERCVWVIRANRRSKINLQLLEDGFQNQSNSDFLSVTEFAGEEQHPVTLITSSRLEHGNKVLHTFQGPVIFLTFYSDSSNPGTGFILKFEGVGNRSDASTTNSVRYTNLHFSAPSGTFKHPKEGPTYQPNELVTVAINPHDATFVKIHMKISDLEKDQYCEFDSINFYGSVTGSYALTKRYCQQSEEFNGEIIQSSDGIFLVIFRSDSSTQFKGFQFAWEVE